MKDFGLPEALAKGLRWPLRLTRAGLWAERGARAFWPAWSIALAIGTLISFDLPVAGLGIEAVWLFWVGAGLGLVAALAWGARRFVVPRDADVLNRLDGQFADRPLAALTDHSAGGAEPNAATEAVWAAHLQRMGRRALAARVVSPDLRLAERDPLGLRHITLTGAAMAALFGSFGAFGLGGGGVAGTGAETRTGPSWEGWANPPAYTGKPALYLNDQTAAVLSLPQGTRLRLRLYGEMGGLILSETVSGRSEAPPASDPAQDFTVTRSGELAIEGPGGRRWEVNALADLPPTVAPEGAVTRKGDGRFVQGFVARDDYGIQRGQARIELDLAAVDRRYGLELDPEAPPREQLDLPLPRGKSNRSEVKSRLVDNLSKSLLANLPVRLTLEVTDAAGQRGQSEASALILPGRRFFDPLAAALIEMRRDLIWNRANAPRVVQVLKAVSWRPDELLRDKGSYLRLRVALDRLEAARLDLSPELRDEIAEELWAIALLLEEGDLASAKERLDRAQDRLQEAIRRGADPAEIERLMEEMRAALDAYMEKLAEDQKDEGREDEISRQDSGGNQLSYDQLQQMMDQLQKLMQEGKTAEAAELMEKIRKFTENMRLAEGQGSGGPQGRNMERLGEEMRRQRRLSDDSFRSLNGQDPGREEGRDPGQGQGEEEEGQDPGQGPSGGGPKNGAGRDPGQEQGTDTPGGAQPRDEGPKGPGAGDDPSKEEGGLSLADRQADIRRQIEALRRGDLPGRDSPTGQEGRDRLGAAGQAMEEAEEALREGDLSGALDRQAEAMEALRDGIRALNSAGEQERRQAGQPLGQEGGEGQEPGTGRDPLGRPGREGVTNGSDGNLQFGEDVRRKADALLDEIRRRSGDPAREPGEKDYLRRLLDLF